MAEDNTAKGGTGTHRLEHEEKDPLVARIEKGQFVEFLDAVTAVVDESHLYINEDGIRIKAVNSENAAMVDATLHDEVFTQFESDGYLLALNVAELQNVIEHLPDDGCVTLLHDPTREVLIVQDGPYHYDLSLIDPHEFLRPPNLPDIEFPARVTLEAGHFKHAVSFFDEFAKHVNIGFDGGGEALWFEPKKYDNSGSDAGARFDKEALVSVSEANDASCIFSLDYLTNLAQPIPDDRNVTIEVVPEFPIGLSYDIALERSDMGSAVSRGEVNFSLAPRIEK